MAFWAAAVAALLLWLLLLLAMALATRNPEVIAGPPAGELADQSPAVVDLITGHWRLTGEAPAATLLDLAARGVVQIEEIGPELSLVRLRHDPGDLNPYEKLVLEHLQALAVDGVVATGALAEGSRDLSRWWKSFRRKVIVDARSQGLSQPRWSRAQAAVLTAAAGVPALAIAVAVTVDDRKHSAGPGAGIVSWVLLTLLMGKLNGERGTRRGAELAGYWLGVRKHFAASGRFPQLPAASVTLWGRHLAYAAALGVAPTAVTSLPVSTPADDRRAWSDYGGMWHVVTVRYPRRMLWAREPRPMLLRALGAGALAGFWAWVVLLVASAFGWWPDALRTPSAFVVGALVAAVPLAYAISDLTRKAEIEGQIVRLRRVDVGSGENRGHSYVHWCAIDQGREREVKAFGISGTLWGALAEGDRVRARVGPTLGWISEIEVAERRQRQERYDDTGEYRIDAPENLGEVRISDPRKE
ncbi:DUF2207 family protein [Peterkaempfera bronchialis]|uniref:DUF2207 domain-containing protein n=1 Tax=Peterkaempfera bronchialis TaxID=2126346 RepID=A0A345T3P0_9ACTN|nr:DUF2207 domain-containing protein [Peterkaempfera bronchialis]AXI80595.1 DUF2207 domain-containing protein [Peterkaempfera bronchialis]